MPLRLAMIFALTDLTNVIDVKHIDAAMAWVRYWVESVKFIFQNAVDEAGAAATTETAQRIATYLTDRGQATRPAYSCEACLQCALCLTESPCASCPQLAQVSLNWRGVLQLSAKSLRHVA